MPKIECAWINCKHNSFKLSEQMKDEIRKHTISHVQGSGECLCNKTVNLSIAETEDAEMEGESLICDNYKFKNKFDA